MSGDIFDEANNVVNDAFKVEELVSIAPDGIGEMMRYDVLKTVYLLIHNLFIVLTADGRKHLAVEFMDDARKVDNADCLFDMAKKWYPIVMESRK